MWDGFKDLVFGFSWLGNHLTISFVILERQRDFQYQLFHLYLGLCLGDFSGDVVFFGEVALSFVLASVIANAVAMWYLQSNWEDCSKVFLTFNTSNH